MDEQEACGKSAGKGLPTKNYLKPSNKGRPVPLLNCVCKRKENVHRLK